MNLSIGELRALALKAAKGGGYEWGMAEEAAEAVIWLERRELKGASTLISLLNSKGAEHQMQCPICLGLALSEGRIKVEGAKLTSVLAPLFLLPFLYRYVKAHDLPLEIRIGDAQMRLDSHSLCMDGCAFAQDDVRIKHVEKKRLPVSHRRTREADETEYECSADKAHNATLAFSGREISDQKRKDRVVLSTQVLHDLQEFSSRTYAPATESSRMFGAGELTKRD